MLLPRRCNTHRSCDTQPACPTCRRIQLEAAIVRKVVRVLLKAGYSLAVDDGDDTRPSEPTTSFSAIIAELMKTDDDKLLVLPASGWPHPLSNTPILWVRFVYGNDGWDVISDYCVGLEATLAPINAYIDRIQP